MRSIVRNNSLVQGSFLLIMTRMIFLTLPVFLPDDGCDLIETHYMKSKLNLEIFQRSDFQVSRTEEFRKSQNLTLVAN